MADFNADFKTKLKAESTVTDLVGAGASARIYPDVPKHNMTLPAIVYGEGRGGESYEHLSGALGTAETVMVVDSYAATRAAANNLAEVVRVALQGPVHTAWGDSHVNSVSTITHRETDVEWTANKQAIKRWITTRIYRITHAEATS